MKMHFLSCNLISIILPLKLGTKILYCVDPSHCTSSPLILGFIAIHVLTFPVDCIVTVLLYLLSKYKTCSYFCYLSLY